MPRPYFSQVPNFDYVSRNKGEHYISDYIPVKNLFKRGKLRDDIFGNLAFFEKYSIIGDERPDNVAFKFYNDPTLDWVVLLSNNILNIQSEWPMTQATFDKVMLDRYGSYDNLYGGIHHYETKEIKNSLDITVLKGGLQINPTWKTNGNFLEVSNSKIDTIFSGDSANPSQSDIVTVYMVNGIPGSQSNGLTAGKQVNINNVSAPEYNGSHTVTEILTEIEDFVFGFRYKLPSATNVAQPTLADPRVEEVLFSVPEASTIQANSHYYEYWDAGLDYSVLVPSTSFIKEVTNYDYEISIEDSKRNIYVLKPQYLNIVFNDIENLMKYKQGGTQYVSATLKKGDNIRLYE